MAAAPEARAAYEVGEEVVVRLAGVGAHDVRAGAAACPACLPPWTIGEVIDRRRRDGADAYAVRFLHRGRACVCIVAEAAIEGTA